MNYWGPLCVLTFFVWLVIYYRSRLAGRDLPYDRRWLLEWIIKGLALPIFIWVILNCGTTPIMPPIVRLAVAKAGAFDRIKILWAQTVPALIAVSSDWAALSMGWFAVGISRRIEERKGFIIASLAFCALLSPFVGVLIFGYGLRGMGFALLIWFWPVVHYGVSLRPAPKRRPVYSNAIAKMKFGKYGEAEMAIIKQLEASENDFDGWMMLADLYASHFHDVSEAEKTICALCDEPATTLPQISIALHRLADWQLKMREDPIAAHRVLEEICRRMPGTHLEKMARLRIDQLPVTRAQLLERQRTKTVHLPASGGKLVIVGEETTPAIVSEEALARANRCVEKLQNDPNDVAVREELARIFADQLGQVDLAVEQIELLMAMPEQPPGKIAECLLVLAGWQVKYRADRQSGRKLLERLIHEYPQTTHAFEAQRRLNLMNVDDKNRKRGNATDDAPIPAGRSS